LCGAAACCSVLQCVAVCVRRGACCWVLRRVVGCCGVLQCVAVCLSVLQSVLQSEFVAVCVCDAEWFRVTLDEVHVVGCCSM